MNNNENKNEKLNEKEEININKEESIIEEKVEVIVEDSKEKNEAGKKEDFSIKDEDNKINFREILLASVTDMLAVSVISALSTVILDFLMRFAGYFISQKLLFAIVLFIPVYIIYNVVMTLNRDKMTIGQKISNLKLVKNTNK